MLSIDCLVTESNKGSRYKYIKPTLWLAMLRMPNILTRHVFPSFNLADILMVCLICFFYSLTQATLKEEEYSQALKQVEQRLREVNAAGSSCNYCKSLETVLSWSLLVVGVESVDLWARKIVNRLHLVKHRRFQRF